MRSYLSQHLDITWGKTWTSITETDDKVILRFSDDSTAEGDILVGADGVHSKGSSNANVIECQRD